MRQEFIHTLYCEGKMYYVLKTTVLEGLNLQPGWQREQMI